MLIMLSLDEQPDFSTASNQACDDQKNACADRANTEPKPNFVVGDCDKQRGE
jgi:hypothetical protein